MYGAAMVNTKDRNAGASGPSIIGVILAACRVRLRPQHFSLLTVLLAFRAMSRCPAVTQPALDAR
jgi:hypothetical protein